MLCYLCKQKKNKVLNNKVRDNKKIKVLQCTNCDLVYLSSFDHIDENFYKKSKMHGLNPSTVKTWLKETKVDDLRRSKQFLKLLKNKKVLDFGCGAGGFVKNATIEAKEIVGVELEERIINYWKGKFNIVPELNQISIKFDTITLFHVLEHLKDPIKILKNLKKYMKKKATIIIEVPNFDDALITLYQNQNFKDFTFWSQHLFLFNSNTLSAVANKAGLKTIKIEQFQRYPLSNHLYWLSKGVPNGHNKWKFLNNNTLNKCYTAELSKLGKCDTIIGYFKL